MLDDAHKLSREQRSFLRKTLIEERPGTATWVAERLEALSPDEILAEGALEKRDYSHVCLEDGWQHGQGKRKFVSLVGEIAERRAQMAADAHADVWKIGSFAATLDATTQQKQLERKITNGCGVLEERLRGLAAAEPRYEEWVAARLVESREGMDRLMALRSLEVLIERDQRKSQLSLDFGLPVSELESREDGSIGKAARLFAANEFGLPYYYGSDCVAQLGFWNVEQFLRLAGDLFEESIGSALIGRHGMLSYDSQDRILKSACERRMKDLPRRAGSDVGRFVSAVGAFCRSETYRPNAPYAPGVTGIAVSMIDRQRLVDTLDRDEGGPLGRFAKMLAIAISQNVFRAMQDYKVKGGRYMVLYLNRISCVTWGLPLQYGGFRERQLAQLVEWMERGPIQRKGLPL